MKLLYICTVLFSFLGCSLSGNNPSAIDDDTRIHFLFVDQEGNDLLNPDHPHAITEHNTDLYYLVKNEKQKVFEKNLDHPKHFHIWKSDETGFYYMTLFPNHNFTNNTSLTYIEFADSSTDTVKIEVEEENIWVCTKVWFNQQLKWSIEDDGYRLLTITKNMTPKD